MAGHSLQRKRCAALYGRGVGDARPEVGFERRAVQSIDMKSGDIYAV
jgi:hypothetical protein